MNQSVTEKLWDILRPVVESEGMELVEIEYKKEGSSWFLRVFVDKEGGVQLRDCRAVHLQIGPMMDVEDLIPHHYTLEVSSPGLDRPLKRLSDYERFKGKLVKIATYAPIDGRKKYLTRIVGVEGENVLLDVEAEKLRLSIPARDIARARLELEL